MVGGVGMQYLQSNHSNASGRPCAACRRCLRNFEKWLAAVWWANIRQPGPNVLELCDIASCVAREYCGIYLFNVEAATSEVMRRAAEGSA